MTPVAAVALGLLTLAIGLASVPLDQMAHQPAPKGSFSLAFVVVVMVPAVAEVVIATFTARLRGTVDLDMMRSDLVSVVHEAFQPAHVSVWLPTTGRT